MTAFEDMTPEQQAELQNDTRQAHTLTQQLMPYLAAHDGEEVARRLNEVAQISDSCLFGCLFALASAAAPVAMGVDPGSITDPADQGMFVLEVVDQDKVDARPGVLAAARFIVASGNADVPTALALFRTVTYEWTDEDEQQEFMGCLVDALMHLYMGIAEQDKRHRAARLN